jgi:hypothetical protein
MTTYLQFLPVDLQKEVIKKRYLDVLNELLSVTKCIYPNSTGGIRICVMYTTRDCDKLQCSDVHIMSIGTALNLLPYEITTLKVGWSTDLRRSPMSFQHAVKVFADPKRVEDYITLMDAIVRNYSN